MSLNLLFSILHKKSNLLLTIFCTQFNVSKYFYVSNNSIKHQSIVYAQLNDQMVLFLIILFSKSHLFGHSLNVKQFYLTHR